MKLLTKEQEDGLWQSNIEGGLKGAAYAAALAGPGFLALQRYSPNYRALPIPLKAFGVIVIAVPLIMVNAEKGGEKYEQSLWTGVGKRDLDAKAAAKQVKWEGLTTMGRAKAWALDHQYSIVGGAWAASMIVAGAIVARNPYLTFPQKLVQARMWAQGLTVGVVIGSGVAAGIDSQGDKHREEVVDHSWSDILEQEARDQKEKDAERRSLKEGQTVASHSKTALK